MEKFEELQSIWNQQSDLKPTQKSIEIIKIAQEKSRIITIKHFWTIGILSTLAFILLAYYIWIYTYNSMSFKLGLGIMIFVIVIRTILEIVSIKKFKKINFNIDLKNHTLQLKEFYTLRKTIHYILTPIIYLIYILGFIILLPQFKQNFSNGMYLYILISGFGFLIFFSFFMIREINKDINNLKFLENVSENF